MQTFILMVVSLELPNSSLWFILSRSCTYKKYFLFKENAAMDEKPLAKLWLLSLKQRFKSFFSYFSVVNRFFLLQPVSIMERKKVNIGEGSDRLLRSRVKYEESGRQLRSRVKSEESGRLLRSRVKSEESDRLLRSHVKYEESDRLLRSHVKYEESERQLPSHIELMPKPESVLSTGRSDTTKVSDAFGFQPSLSISLNMDSNRNVSYTKTISSNTSRIFNIGTRISKRVTCTSNKVDCNYGKSSRRSNKKASKSNKVINIPAEDNTFTTNTDARNTSHSSRVITATSASTSQGTANITLTSNKRTRKRKRRSIKPYKSNLKIVNVRSTSKNGRTYTSPTLAVTSIKATSSTATRNTTPSPSVTSISCTADSTEHLTSTTPSTVVTILEEEIVLESDVKVESKAVEAPVIELSSLQNNTVSTTKVFESTESANEIINIQDELFQNSNESESVELTQIGIMPKIDEEVAYLYSVDISEKRLIEQVDLTVETEKIPENKCDDSPSSSIDLEICSGDRSVDTNISSSKRNPDVELQSSRQKRDRRWTAHCVVCKSDYYTIQQTGRDLLCANCGHMYCDSCQCSVDMKGRRCNLCSTHIFAMYKVFLKATEVVLDA